MDEAKSDRWKLYERMLLLLTALLIPATVWLVASGTEREKLRIEYVRIATGILQQRSDEPDTQRGMREWAVAVLNKSAPIKLSVEQANALIQGTARLPRSANIDDQGFDWTGYDYGYGPDQLPMKQLNEDQKRKQVSPSPTSQ